MLLCDVLLKLLTYGTCVCCSVLYTRTVSVGCGVNSTADRATITYCGFMAIE